MLNDYALIGLVLLDSEFGIYKNGKYFYEFKEDTNWFLSITTDCILVMSEDHFINCLDAYAREDCFTVVICTTEDDVDKFVFGDVYKDKPILFTCSTNPNTWINTMYDNAFYVEDFKFAFDSSRIYVLGGTELFDKFWGAINIFYVTQLWLDFKCDEFVDVDLLNSWIPVYEIQRGNVEVLSPYITWKEKASYSIDLYVRKS